MEEIQRGKLTLEDIYQFYESGQYLKEHLISTDVGEELLRRISRVMSAKRLATDSNFIHLTKDVFVHTKLEISCSNCMEPGIRVFDYWFCKCSTLLEEDPGYSIIQDMVDSINDNINELMEELGKLEEQKESILSRWKNKRED